MTALTSPLSHLHSLQPWGSHSPARTPGTSWSLQTQQALRASDNPAARDICRARSESLVLLVLPICYGCATRRYSFIKVFSSYTKCYSCVIFLLIMHVFQHETKQLWKNRFYQHSSDFGQYTLFDGSSSSICLSIRTDRLAYLFQLGTVFCSHLGQ